MLLALAVPAAAQGTVPLPTKRSTILRKEGVVYFVEGRQKIPRGCEISVQKDVLPATIYVSPISTVAGFLVPKEGEYQPSMGSMAPRT